MYYEEHHAKPVVRIIRNTDYEWEEYIYEEMVNQVVLSQYGYPCVTIELLYGSHSADIHLIICDMLGNEISYLVIETQAYDVILDMIDCFSDIVPEFGGIHTHEAVEWKEGLMSQ